MTTEEKAKAYDEALDWMRELYPTMEGAVKEDAEHFFPELKESEDERIRKMIENTLRDAVTSERVSETSYREMLAYLEKQKDAEIEIEKAYKNADEIQYKKGFEDGVASVKPAEWSEEDEAFLKVAIAICNRYSHKDIADWLESLRPQPHWKPSKEQMSSLWQASIYYKSGKIKITGKTLESLYNDLKKL